jgi:6-pyruvoyltetrahydropterin/6-carboxytetrahydropterin synthase
MGMTSLTRRYRFAAAHRLHSDHLSEAENWAVFGKCNNPNGHGHNYVLLVTVREHVDPGTGRVTDVETLDRIVHDTVVARFDHRDLNQDPAFSARTTTGENLVLFIWDLLVGRFPAGVLEKIGIIETRDNYFEYSGSAAVRTPAGRVSERG